MTDDRTLSVTFEYVQADMQAYCRHLMGHSPLIRRFFWIAYPIFLVGSFVFPFAKAALAGAPLDREVWEMAVVSGVIPALAMLPILLWWGPWMLARQTLRNPIAAGPRTVTLSSGGVSSRFGTGEEAHSWDELVDIAVTPRILVFYWGTAQGLPVPRRAFASEEAFQSFVGAAREFQSSAGGAPVPAASDAPSEATVLEDRVSVSYHLTAADFAALQKYQLVGARSHMLRLTAFALLSVPIGWFNAGWVGAVLGPVILALLIAATNWYQRRKLAGGPHGRGLHTLTADKQGITTGAEGVGRGNVRWNLVSSVDGAPEHLFVTLVTGGAYLVPRSAFATPVDSDRALELMRRWHQRGQEGKAKRRK